MLKYIYLVVADARWLKDVKFFIHTSNVFVQIRQNMEKSDKDWKNEMRLKESRMCSSANCC